jgi:histidinol-phosphatase (PHP family)
MSTASRFDTHVHTLFSPDGRSGLADYARRVDEGAADGIGFTEHYEFRPESDAYRFFGEPAYQAAVAEWKSRGYRFWAGVEVGWAPQDAATIRAKLAEHRFDYAIGSVHNLPSASISGRDTSAFRDSLDKVIVEYAEAVTSSLTVEEFDVVGHPGVFLRHFAPAFFEGQPWVPRWREMEDDLAQRVVRSGKLLEVNTSGFFTARGEPCAGSFFLERYKAYGGQRITLGSDAHEAARLRQGFVEAGKLLSSLGFDEIYLPWDQDRPVTLKAYIG